MAFSAQTNLVGGEWSVTSPVARAFIVMFFSVFLSLSFQAADRPRASPLSGADTQKKLRERKIPLLGANYCVVLVALQLRPFCFWTVLFAPRRGAASGTASSVGLMGPRTRSDPLQCTMIPCAEPSSGSMHPFSTQSPL